jgi:enterochelin esterase-like enzyme
MHLTPRSHLMLKLRWLTAAVLSLPVAGIAQESKPAIPASLQPPAVASPVVHADRTITFNFRAPSAQKVELSGQFLKGNQPMQKNKAGIWSITVGPVEPDLYPYNFVVDGTGVADPLNPDHFPNERFKPSLVDVPGETPSLHAVQPVPHGVMSYGFYESKTLQRTRPLVIYTPPGYQSGTEKYPVFYLVSGTTDTEETWFRAGRVNFILDNLIAQKKAVPMIVVMPYGNMMMGAPMPSSPEVAVMYQAFSDELTGSIMPYVESTYRVLPDREKRAIAGFSRGGGQSLFTGFKNPDKFAWIASYSAYLTPEVCGKHFPGLAADTAATNARLKLLWLGVGKADFLHKPAVQFDAFLREKGITHTWLETEGGHTWMNARHYLAETLQLYFKP